MSLEVSALTYECFVWRVPRKPLAAGVIRYAGTYRPGSAGASDALFIKWKINEFCELSSPSRIFGLIVDLQELAYTWGDDLSVYPARMVGPENAIRVLVREAQYDTFKLVLPEGWLRTDFQVACAEVADIIASSGQ